MRHPQTPLLSPKFLGSRIASLNSLAGQLGVSVTRLTTLASTSDGFYRLQERIEKPDGSIRYIYDVNQPLKRLLRKINSRFSLRCEYPQYLTGALPGWSYVKNAALHAGQGTVIAIDATNFFPSVTQDLVEKIWKEFYGFDDSVSKLLAELCCHRGVLAQGSPPSSYLANLAFWDIEPLIVKELASQGYVYSRYVDDICVSHPRMLSLEEKNRIIRVAQKVFLSRGLKVKSRKTKVMDRNTRQEVNKRTVNAGRVCASRQTKNQLRARLHRFTCNIASNQHTDVPIEKQYKTLKGKLHDFRQFNRTAANKMLAQLDASYAQARPHGEVRGEP